MKRPKLIRKYVNRRLYDTTQSRYVNLDELRELIIAGDDIQVVEQASQADITTTVLLQILEDSQQSAAQILKPDFLARIIRLSHADSDPNLPERLSTVLGSAEKSRNHLTEGAEAKRLVRELHR
jgi:polyhydroxyalkanoate synthesis repressor PhaR